MIHAELPPAAAAGVSALLAAATPFLRITHVKRRDWCRDTQDKRHGPWRYRAHFDVLDAAVWSRSGEVLYLAYDALGRLRLAGESSRRLKDRWRESPMHAVGTRLPLGERALFHTTSWPAIEAAFDAGEQPPFTVSALFSDDLEVVCRQAGGPLAVAAGLRRTRLHGLA